MKIIETANAPKPQGHYSQAVVHEGVIYVSVQLPIPPQARPTEPLPPVAEQARQAIENVIAVVAAAGGSRDTLLKVTIYLSDIAFWPAVNDVYEQLMGEARPARGVVPTGKLHLGYDVAIDAVAHTARN